MAEKRPNNLLVLDILLGVLTLFSTYLFFVIETNRFFESAIGVLILYSIWQYRKKDNGPLLFVIGFIVATLSFYYAEIGMVSNIITSLIIFALIIFLFSYRHLKTEHPYTPAQLFNTYTVLLGLLVTELFYILTYFEIASKNKAILVILFMWFYDEIFEHFESKELNKKFTWSITIIFLIIFVILALTFPFKLV